MKRAARLGLLALAAAAVAVAARRGLWPGTAEPDAPAPPPAPAAEPAVATAEAAPAPRPITLWVAVTSAGVPVEEARVALVQAGTGQSMTFPMPKSGKRAVQGLPGGRYRCRAQRAGFLPAVADVEVCEGDSRTVVLELRKGARVSGRAVDRLGRPVPGAWVHAVDPDQGGPVADCLETRTDAAGEFRLEGAPPGVIDVRIRHDRYRPARRPRLYLSDGADLRMEDVVLEDGGLLEGRVTDEEGIPVGGATVVLSNEEVGSARSGPDGAFAVHGLGDGPAAGFASAPGYGTARLSGLRPGAKGIEFRLPRVASLSGVVLGVPVGVRFGVRLLRFDSDAGAYVPLSFRGFDGGPEAAFELPDVSPGIYRISVESPGFQAIEVPDVVLGPGERRTGLRLRLRPSAPPR